jgi:hypothetical protein
MTERDKSITEIWGTIKTYPVLIQFNEICCGEHIEDEKVCGEMEKEYSLPPGVDTKCDCFVENLKVDAVGDKMADKGFPTVKVTFYLPKVNRFGILPYLPHVLYGGVELTTSIKLERSLIIEIARFYHIYYHIYNYKIFVHSPREIPEPVTIEKPYYEIKGWVEQKKGITTFSTPEIIDIETPDKGRLSYAVLVPEYDVIINVEPNGTAEVVILDSRYYGPECIEPLVKNLRRKILG